MLKASRGYEYVEVAREPETTVTRRRKLKVPSLPVGLRQMATAAYLPLQSYLRERFSHIGRKDKRFKALRDENQRRHNLAASRGAWQMSRTS